MRTQSGFSRVEVVEAMSLLDLHQQVLEHVPEAALGRFALSFDPAGQQPIPADEHVTIGSQSLKYS